jgi:hypothetical protein
MPPIPHAAIRLDGVERREVTLAGGWIEGRDGTACDVTRDADDGLPDPNRSTDPPIFLVGSRPGDLDQHSKSARVEGLRSTKLLLEAMDRCMADE